MARVQLVTGGAGFIGANYVHHVLADRPGDDFAWIVDGAAVGRLVVQGSHLVEGHR